jgi:RNA polymerase sigma factor (sigma-70 family)
MTTRPESVTREMERLINERRGVMLKYTKMKGVQPFEQVEDCVSLATIRFFNHFDHTLGYKPVTYLYTVMNNTIREWHRNQIPFTRYSGSRKPIMVSGLEDDAVDNLAISCADPFRQYDSASAAKEKVERLRRRLNPNQKQVLTHMLQGLGVAESATLLNISVGRIWQLRNRIREHALECGVCS